MSYKPSDSRYDTMIYRRCGNSGLKLPIISLGLWQNFGDVNDFKNSQDLVFTAFDSGITHFDLANNYGPPPGTAESNFGKILAQDLKGYRDELIISTKAGYDMWPGPYGEWGSKKYLMASLDQSLKRMGLDYVDIFYSHRFDPETPLEETMEALYTAVQQGKALYVGISNYNSEQSERAAAILKERGIRCLINQPKYSMFERWVERDNLIPTLENLGMGMIPFSPLAQGLLTDRYLNKIPEDSRAARDGSLNRTEVSEESLSKVRALNEIATGRGQSLAQMALAWVLRDERVTTVLIGASKVSQLEANLGTINRLGFDADELEKIERILG